MKASLSTVFGPMANQLRLLEERAVTGNADINAFNQEILKITDQLHAASKLHSMNFLDTESYYEKANALNAHLEEVQKERQQLIRGITQDGTNAMEKTEQLIRILQGAPKNLSTFEEGDIFSDLVVSVLVDKDKKITFRLINGMELIGWEGVKNGKN